MDLLLHLIRSNQMDIYNINVESITKQYIDFINQSKEMNMDVASEYLVMASELIHLKSKLLLHKDDKVDEEDDTFEINSEEDLRDKLLKYEEMKRLTGEFSILEDKRSEFYTRLPSSLEEYKDSSTIVSGETTLDDLVDAFKSFLEREKYNKPLNTKITRKEYSVNERTTEIRSILKQRKKCDFTSLFEEVTRPYVVVTFLSILEMSKNKEINIIQDKTFGNITVEMV
ncbi:MAG: segregation/condensation protein A [Bacilli bacterium]|nr:segregation/condensation protein A [Bacilli bacterium]